MGGDSAVEQLDDRLRKVRELTQRWKDWLAVEKLGFVERYIQKKLNLVVRRRGIPGRQDGIVFYAHPGIESHSGRGTVPGDGKGLGVAENCDQSSMLSRNVQVVNGRKHIIPSIVRLEVFDDDLIGIRKPVYLFVSPVFLCRELPRAAADWKVDVFWRHCAISLGERDGEHIQAAPDAVDNGPDLSVDDQGHRLDISDANELLARLRIQVFQKRMRAFLTPSGHSPAKNWELGFGPINIGLGR